MLLSSELGQSRLTLEAGGLRIAAESRDPTNLAYIKMIMADHVLEFEDAGVTLHWDGDRGGRLAAALLSRDDGDGCRDDWPVPPSDAPGQ